jgi:hypothetical protein
VTDYIGLTHLKTRIKTRITLHQGQREAGAVNLPQKRPVREVDKK